MDNPKIYVACLAAYNSGYLHGAWCDATPSRDEIYQDIVDMLASSPIEGAEEWAIHDYSGFGKARIDEYEGIEQVVRLAEFIVEHGKLGAVLLGDYSMDDAETFLTDHYHGAYDCEVDFAQNIFDDCYSEAIPNNLLYYFDHEAFSRDLFMSDYFSVEAQGQTHVFSHY